MTPNLSQQEALLYIRAKVDQLLTVMGAIPLRPEELDDDTLIALDPIGAFVTPGAAAAFLTLVIWTVVVGGQPTWP